MYSVKLRKAKPSDFDPLVELFTNARVRKYLGGVLRREDAELRAENYIVSKRDTDFVVEVEGDFCGLITLSSHIEEPGTEVSFQFLPNAYGKGIANESLTKVKSLISDRIVAETQLAIISSRKLLNRLGFIEVKQVSRHTEQQVIAVLEK
ncbi:GNAT family N-acetyltransferase [Reinekea marina]|uniref:GNAT family N-acetyltransferase n=1 Tax=Reinekea marina TaxID=1310421 RepID=A0ABV7WSJ8_9GAMM|nr:GNAT family N-acetyltransferase [Reinekea marina]MDN3649068.1 GNAT family N-acetyltransferase [Reinekea marina]